MVRRPLGFSTNQMDVDPPAVPLLTLKPLITDPILELVAGHKEEDGAQAHEPWTELNRLSLADANAAGAKLLKDAKVIRSSTITRLMLGGRLAWILPILGSGTLLLNTASPDR